MNEEWKDIPGWEGMYRISSFGNVLSLPRRDNRNRSWGGIILKPMDAQGYLCVHLTRNGKSTRYLIHRLVAEAFLPNPNNLKEINHKDENKKNNALDNLEWCTRSYNVTYGKLDKEFRKRRVAGERNGRSVLTYEEVIEIRSKYVKGSKEHNIASLAKEYGVCNSQIGNIVRGQQWIPKYI